MPEMRTPRDRLFSVQERLQRAAQSCGRVPGDIELLAVTKLRSIDEIRELQLLGLNQFGENRVAEALNKMPSLEPNTKWHMIGHLQSNKVRDCLAFTVLQSLDRIKLAKGLQQVLLAHNQQLEVLLEVNTGGEEQKGGTRTEDELWALADVVCACSQLKWKGLMTMAPFTRDEAVVRPCFSRLFQLRQSLLTRFPGAELPVLSMGMSNDFEWAIAEGATMVRIGTLLFEERP